jgi:hypothetical protein
MLEQNPGEIDCTSKNELRAANPGGYRPIILGCLKTYKQPIPIHLLSVDLTLTSVTHLYARGKGGEVATCINS